MFRVLSEYRLASGAALSGIGLLCIGAVLNRRRRVSSAVSSTANSSDLKISKTDDLCNRSAVPIELLESNLPSGWSVAPPIFESGKVAIIPLVQPWCATAGEVEYKSHECFIFCEGPLNDITLATDAHSLELFFSRYIRARRFLDALNARDVQLARIEKREFLSAHGCFTHVAIANEEHLAVLFGRNGPYIISLIVTNYYRSAEEDSAGSCCSVVTKSDVQMIIDACRLVPLIDNVRLPDTPTGLLQGRLRITCVHKGFDIVFTTLSGVRIQTGDDNNLILRIQRDVSPKEKISLDCSFLDKLIEGMSLESLLLSCGVQTPCSVIVSVHVEKKGGNLISQTPLESVTTVFSHSSLGVYFSVNSKNAVIREPMMTDDLCVFYYPCGDTAMDEEVNSVALQASIRLVKKLPPTWKNDFLTDEDLKRSVLFHFTDWAHEQVPCSITQISGYRCVQLYEENEGFCCRSYIIPFENAVFVIRWEAELADWEKHLLLLHDFLDTLHLADPTV